MRNTKLKPKWKPGQLIKTIAPKELTSIYDESWRVVLGLIIEKTQYYTFNTDKKENYYKILIQNLGVVERIYTSIYPLDTPDKVILDKENEIPF